MKKDKPEGFEIAETVQKEIITEETSPEGTKVVARFTFSLDGKIIEKGTELELNKAKANNLITRGFVVEK